MAGTIIPAVTGTEEGRAFLQERLSFFARLAAVFVLATYVALMAAEALADDGSGNPWLGTYGALHASTAAVLALV